MEDMGPQASGSIGVVIQQGMQGIDVEAAVGRRAEGHEEIKSESEPTTPKREAVEEIEGESKRLKVEEEANKGDDEEMVLVDADGKAEGEEKVGEGMENVSADVVDTSPV